MANKSPNDFHFKQFSISQHHAAMKLGTDAVLLGAWMDASRAIQVLDIGTGTGILSLMLAQRFEKIQIDAIDTDADAIRDAVHNCGTSKFSNRISVQHSSLQNFASEKIYDSIICNPPFFNEALLSSDNKRNTARHDNALSLGKLVQLGIARLHENGNFALVFPYDRFQELKLEFARYAFYPYALCKVFSKPGGICKRVMVDFRRDAPKTQTNELIIYKETQNYSDAYKALTADFYL